MATAARDRLAGMLGGEAAAASSMQLKAGKDDLRLQVEGIGRVQFPVSAAQARHLIQLGWPAQFGRGEETLTDREVRDTWEIPKTWSQPNGMRPLSGPSSRPYARGSGCQSAASSPLTSTRCW